MLGLWLTTMTATRDWSGTEVHLNSSTFQSCWRSREWSISRWTETRAFALCKWRLIRREMCSNAFLEHILEYISILVKIPCAACNQYMSSEETRGRSFTHVNKLLNHLYTYDCRLSCWLVKTLISNFYEHPRDNQNDFTIHSNIHLFTRFQ